MKIKDKTRTRLTGYFGLAVATLLTPGGKLISSAVAAATVASLIGMNMATKQDQANQPVSTMHSGALPTDGEILGIGNLTTTDETSDTLSAETLIPEPNAALGNQTAFAAQTRPFANIAAVNAVGVGAGGANAGGALSTFDPKISAPHDPDPIKRDPKECTVVILGELARNTEIAGDKVTCLEKDTLASSEGNPESQTDSESQPVSKAGVPETGIPESGAPGTVVPKSWPASYSEPVLLATPEYIGPDAKDVSAAQTPLVVAEQDQPFISIATIPEPSTLGLFLMGLMGFVQVYRKNKAI